MPEYNDRSYDCVAIDYMSVKGGNMQSLGMLALGTFIGWVVSYGLLQVTNWANPGNVFSAVISAAVAGGVFTFIQFLGGPSLGTALFMYPLGLAYGALCAALIWVGQERTLIMILHIMGFTVASALLLALLLSSDFRALLGPT